MRSARTPPPETSVGTHCRSGPPAWALKTPLCQFHLHQISELDQNLSVEPWRLSLDAKPVGGLLTCYIGTWKATDKLNFHMDLGGLTYFLWAVSQNISFMVFWAPCELSCGKQVTSKSIQQEVLLLLSPPVLIPWYLKQICSHSSESSSLAFLLAEVWSLCSEPAIFSLFLLCLPQRSFCLE